MQSQQKAESDLLRLYGRMVTTILVLLVMAVIGIRYFSYISLLGSPNLELEHTRFLNVVAMVRSQWLSLGKPRQMQLDWEILSEPNVNNKKTLVVMSMQGWPQPNQLDDQGCQLLWQQLMGQDIRDTTLIGVYFSKDNSCRYRSENGNRMDYLLDSGRVVFLTDS